MENRAFYPEKMPLPGGPYAHGVEIPEDAKLTFTAGQIGMDLDGNTPDDFESQARNAWNNCLTILEHNRLRVSDVVKINHFLTDPAQIPAYNAIREEYLGENRPASTLLIVAGLASPNLLVEVEMIAASTRKG
ncbi:MAG: RidA family protein [Alphaproteobacteria bacterium]|nr:RidA family protein [Alphaproteobacteria bacterium]